MDGVTVSDVQTAAIELGLADRPVCVHSSLRSFGHVEGGAPGIVDGLLRVGSTVLVPTFSWESFAHPPPPGHGFTRNGLTDAVAFGDAHDRCFTPDSNEIDAGMGAIPRAVLTRAGRARGDHPLCSFSAIGPLGSELVGEQRADDVFAPLRALVTLDGLVLLMGVDLTSMTLLHLAEVQAGRSPFVRWAIERQGGVRPVEVGGCSAGFMSFEAVLNAEESRVGASRWLAFNAPETLRTAVDAIDDEPLITRCGTTDCARCLDAIAGGPRRSA